jgi:hypothetical protein
MSIAFHPGHYVASHETGWDKMLPASEFVVNAWHHTIQSAPFSLDYGQHRLTPEQHENIAPFVVAFSRGLQKQI